MNKEKNTNNDGSKKKGGNHEGSPPPPKLGKQFLVWMVLIAGVMVLLMFFRQTTEDDAVEVDLLTFERNLERGLIESMEIKDTDVTASLIPDAQYEKITTTVKSSYLDSQKIDEWKKHLPKDRDDALTFDESVNIWPMVLANVLPVLILLLVLMYFLKRQMQAAGGGAGSFPFSKSKVEANRHKKPDVTFDDVAGVDEAKEELQETVEFLKNPKRFQKIGGRTPRGVLLVGHPGTGKTLLSKAVAGEAGVPFFSLSGSDFVELFVGVGASRARDLFSKAKENQPCIIFLDEIDAVGRKRGAGLGGGHDEREQTLNAILSEMDGFERQDGIIVIAATNRPDVLDQALLRPGRFDRQIVVDLPDLKGREEILKVHAQRIRLAKDVPLSVIARGTPGFSGADLEALINEGALIAGKSGKERVELLDLEEARDKVRFGRQKKSRVMSDEDREMTAYHEAGHALIALLNPDVEPLHKVSIIPRGVALGMTMMLPEKDKYGMRKRECLGTIQLQMAGRVAESIFCEDISSGAKDDIENATKLARKMITQWGMSEKLGAVNYSNEDEHVFLGNEIARPREHGEHIAQQIDEEIHSLLQDSYEKAREIIEKHKDQVQGIGQALLELETLDNEDVKKIVEGKNVDELVQENRTRLAEQKKKSKVSEEKETQQDNEQESDVRPVPQPAENTA